MSESLVGDIISKLNHLCPDKIGLDIGANHGSYTGQIAKQCKTVYAFEPHIENFRTLMKNVDDENAIFVNAAVSVQNGRIRLYTCGGNPGGHTIALSVASKTCYDHKLDRFIDVHAISLDQYFSDETNIGFIKIDVEGAEEFVLNGANKILDNNKIIIVLETHQTIEKERLYKYMVDKGYVFLDEQYKPVTELIFDSHYVIHNLGEEFKI